MAEFRESVANWYKNRFNVSLDPGQEVVSLIGSKEGIGNMAVAFVDPGDVVLVSSPCYPVYHIGTAFSGGKNYFLPLKKENNFLPDLDAIPADIAKQAKLLWINYPNNPTAAVADKRFFERVVEFANQYNVIVCHDRVPGPRERQGSDDRDGRAGHLRSADRDRDGSFRGDSGRVGLQPILDEARAHQPALRHLRRGVLVDPRASGARRRRSVMREPRRTPEPVGAS